MSLLNDALKRAKLEAIERQAEEKGILPVPATVTSTRRRRFPWLAVSVGLLVIAMLGAGVVWWLARSGAAGDSGPSEPTPERYTTPETRGEERSSLDSVDREEIDRDGVATDAPAESQATIDTSEPPTSQLESSSAAASDNEPISTDDLSQGQEPIEEARIAVPPPQRLQLEDGQTFVGSLDFDGGRLALSGIVYSGSNSVAVINGAPVGAEETVEGFLVVAVEREKIQLQGHGVTVYLALP